MPRPLPVGLAGRIHLLDRLVLAYHPPQFLPRARVGLLNRGHPWPLFGGEAVACRDDGVASFDLIRHWHHADGAFLYAFDLIKLNGDDLRRDPLIVRKATLASVLARAAPGLRLRPKRRDLRAGADQLWIELGINRLADAGTAANDALAASITAMRTSSLSTSTTHGLGELIAVVRECADAAATAGRLGRPHYPIGGTPHH